jgi:3-phosphoshikimate 1-carboxyvinyltransferase
MKCMPTLESLWPAPYAGAPVDAVVRVPGSKSVTNRALVLAALADEPSRLTAPLRARDSTLMAAALRVLGVGVADDGDDWVVTPAPLTGGGTVEVGLAGTVQRFVPPLAALADGPVRVDGDPRARERPLAPLLAGLRALGARIEDGGSGGLPLTVHGAGRLAGGVAAIDASASSQFVSGLLLAAPRYDRGLRLRHTGAGPVPSALQVGMTVHMLGAAGAAVESDPDGREWTVQPGRLRGGELAVAPDLSSAAPFVAAAVATGGRVRVPGWPRRSLQPGDLLPELLTRMGATCVLDDDGLTVTAGDRLDGLDADLADCTELVPALVALAALARTPSALRGIGHMRGHETDRLTALATELTRLGGEVSEAPDGLRVVPRPLHGGTVRTYHDHRIAMFGAVLGLAVPGVLVEDVATTGKTVPDFVDRWTGMLGTAPAGAPH